MDELLNINNDDHDYIWLEDDGRYARYQVAIDEYGDGISEWFCINCGNCIDEACQYCDDHYDDDCCDDDDCYDDEGDDMD